MRQPLPARPAAGTEAVEDEEVGDAVDDGEGIAPTGGTGGGDRSSGGREAAAASSGDFGFSSLHPGVLAALPRFISEQLPCVFTARGAIDRLTMEGFKIGMATSNSVDQELNRTEELFTAQFYRNMYLYFSFAQSLKAQGAPRPAPRGAAPRSAGVLRPAPPRPAPPRPAPPRPAPPRPAPPRPAQPRPTAPRRQAAAWGGQGATRHPAPCRRATRRPAPAVCDGPLLTPHSRNPPPFPPQPTAPPLGPQCRQRQQQQQRRMQGRRPRQPRVRR
jgi:hypothetical protein